ncbi:C40 family peptidase [Brevibacillus sp. B_LB10_24]|uniref:C40 family peptidase n=1 Tax=Brevibacillus sp. B_LB10_24 TaxID=3380645 RepID=UPI0038BB1062
MKKRNWKTGTLMAVLVGASCLMTGQAFAESNSSNHHEGSHTYKYQLQKQVQLDGRQENDDNTLDTNSLYWQIITRSYADGQNLDISNPSDNTSNSVETDNPQTPVEAPQAAQDSSTLNINSIKSAVKTPKANTRGQQIIKAGEKYMGTPYKFGGGRKNKSTMDCSGFTMIAYKEGAGIDLGKGGARSQYKQGTPIARKNLQVGDLVFFSTKATMKYPAGSINRIGHVGIYAGNNKILHTYGKPGVTFSSMASGWWDQHYVGAVRITK